MSKITIDELTKGIFNTLKTLENSLNIKVYLGFVPEGTNFPFILIRYIDGTTRHFMQTNGLDEHYIQVGIYSQKTSVSEVYSIAEQADRVLDKLTIPPYILTIQKISTNLFRGEDYWGLVLRYKVVITYS